MRTTPLCEVLHKWHSEEDFIDTRGKAAILPFGGESGSFSSLVKRFGGDIPPGAMRTELKRVGAVVEDDLGNLQVVRRTVTPKGAHENLIAALAHSVYPIISTIAHNIDPDREGDTWAQMTAFTQAVRASDIPRLRRISSDRLAEVSESFDDLFMAYESLHDTNGKDMDCNTIAVGVFYFEDTVSGRDFEW